MVGMGWLVGAGYWLVELLYLEELLKPLPLTQAGMELEEGLTVFDQVGGVAALLC